MRRTLAARWYARPARCPVLPGVRSRSAMRKALVVLAIPSGTDRPRTRARRDRNRHHVRRGPDPGLREGEPEPDERRPADARHRQPGVPALVGRRRDAEAVEDLEPVQRPGLRVGGRLRGREAARLREGARWTGSTPRSPSRTGRATRTSTSTWRRSRTRPSAIASVDFSNAYYYVNQALVGREGTQIASAKSIAALKPYQLGAQLGTTSYQYIVRHIRADSQAARIRLERPRCPGAEERSDRRDRRRPADGVLRHRRAGRGRRDRRPVPEPWIARALRDGASSRATRSGAASTGR